MCSVLWGRGFGSIIVAYDSCGIPQTNYMCYLIDLSPEVAVNNPFLNILFIKQDGVGKALRSIITHVLLYDLDGNHDGIGYP